jgi:acetaldehyde dehydrogenase (acetylating)
MAFGLEKPVFRIVVNTMSTLGAIGLTTGVMPSLTLGAGGVGGSITGDNVTAYHLFNVKRLAYELSSPPEAALRGPSTAAAGTNPSDAQDIEALVRKVVQEIIQQK